MRPLYSLHPSPPVSSQKSICITSVCCTSDSASYDVTDSNQNKSAFLNLRKTKSGAKDRKSRRVETSINRSSDLRPATTPDDREVGAVSMTTRGKTFHGHTP